MHRARRLAVVMLATLALTAATPQSAAAPADDGGSASACCYANPRFKGVCRVEPTGDETCASILAYLNNPNSVGKTYCGSTEVRGGWTQVECEDEDGGACAGSAPPGDAPHAPDLAGHRTL